MASANKKAKTNKKNHSGRAGWFLKEGKKMQRVCFYGKHDRVKLNAEAEQDA